MFVRGKWKKSGLNVDFVIARVLRGSVTACLFANIRENRSVFCRENQGTFDP